MHALLILASGSSSSLEKEKLRWNERAYTLAMYLVKAGQEEAFMAAWNELADTFSSLPNPPLRGTLIRHRANRTLFYSFGPWRIAEHVATLRQNPEAGEALKRLHKLCVEPSLGDYEMVTYVDVEDRGSA